MSADTLLKKDFKTLVEDMLHELRQPGLGRVPLTDAHEGSVVRTLVETYARELALCYEQLERIYRMGYLDTASGQALDLVVALVGVERRKEGWLEGMATFRRGTPAPADIPIPAGTLIGGKDAPLCETVQSAVLPAGTTQVTVKVRSVERPKADVVTLAAGSLTFMPRVLNGIDSVTNERDLVLSKKPESDDELRERARHAVDGSNLGTLEALRVALARHGFSEVKLEEPPDVPGVVRVRVEGLQEGDEQTRRELQAALDRARPAGVQVKLEGTDPLYVGIRATLVLDRERSDPEKEKIRGAILAGLSAYFAGLKIGEAVLWSKVNNILGADPAVTKVEGLLLHPATQSQPLAEGADVLPGLNQRGRLDPARAPLDLKFVPAALLVQVDAAIKVTAGVATRDMIQKALEKVLGGIKPPGPFSLQKIRSDLEKELPGTTLTLTLTLLHRHNGLVVELLQDTDTDRLAEREQLKLGQLEVKPT